MINLRSSLSILDPSVVHLKICVAQFLLLSTDRSYTPLAAFDKHAFATRRTVGLKAERRLALTASSFSYYPYFRHFSSPQRIPV